MNESSFWDWTIGDVAAVLTLGLAAAFGIWNWLIPYTLKIFQKGLSSWPITAEFVSVEWNHPGYVSGTTGQVIERQTIIHVVLRVKPRKYTTSAISSPSMAGYFAKVNGRVPYDYRTYEQINLGQEVDRTRTISFDIAWEPDDYKPAGAPNKIELTLFVKPPVGELRTIQLQTENIRTIS